MTTFRTVLLATAGNNVGIQGLEEILLGLNHGKRVPVTVTTDGASTYTTTTGMTGSKNLISFNAETRKNTGRGAGDEVEVHLQLDPERATA